MPSAPQDALQKAIAAAAILCGQHDEKKKWSSEDKSSGHDRVQGRLRDRLDAYYGALGGESGLDAAGPSQGPPPIEEETGQASIRALQNIHHAFLQAMQAQRSFIGDASSSVQDAPLLGARDAKTLRILLSIVGNWGLLPLIRRFDVTFSHCNDGKEFAPSGNRSTELPSDEEEAELRRNAKTTLQSTIRSIDAVLGIFRDMLSSTSISADDDIIASGIRASCAPHLLALGVRLGWCPQLEPAQLRARENGCHLVSFLLKSMSTLASLKSLSGTSQITAAAVAHAEGSRIPAFVRAATERLYSAQLLRPDGVMALLRISLSHDEANERGMMRKLTSIGHLLSTPPAGMPTEVFVRATFPRLLQILGQLPGRRHDAQAPSFQSTTAQKNAACYALARQREVDPETFEMMMNDSLYRHLSSAEKTSEDAERDAEENGARLLDALLLLHGIAEHSEPSSDFLCALLGPANVALFSIFSVCSVGNQNPIIDDEFTQGKSKASDAEVAKQAALDLLKTWLKLSESKDAMALLSPSRMDGLFGLQRLPTGALCVRLATNRGMVPVLATRRGNLLVSMESSAEIEDVFAKLQRLAAPEIDLQASSASHASQDDLTSSILSSLDLAPSPTLLSAILEASGMRDLASELLVALLEAYQSSEQKLERNEEPLASVLYLQHIMQLCDVFGAKLLNGQTEKVLLFVAFALQGSRDSNGSTAENSHEESGKNGIETFHPVVEKRGPTSHLFNIRNNNEDSRTPYEDEDDEESNELKETALNLLLSVLEGDPSLTAQKHSLLLVIKAQLESVASSSNESVRALAREAILVLTARDLAKDSRPATSDTSLLSPREQAFARGRAKYQEALKLLQDPILPVRAHGLIVLKDLIAASSSGKAVNLDSASTAILLDEALVPAILDIFLKAVCDDESFLYLNAVKGLAELGNMGSRSLVKRLVALYVGDNEVDGLSQAEVDKRLRVGEALLQVVQRLEEALSSYASDLVAPLLAAVRNAKLPTTLRSSILSLLGTCIEASPTAMASQGHATAIASGMLDLLSIEMSRAKNTTQEQVDDALETGTKLPQLRRAAILLLILLVRGTSHQLQSTREKASDKSLWPEDTPRLDTLRMPGGATIGSTVRAKPIDADADLLFPTSLLSRLQTTIAYVQQFDEDALVRHQSEELLRDVDHLRLEQIHGGVQAL